MLFLLQQYLRVLSCILIVEGYILWARGQLFVFLRKTFVGIFLFALSVFAFSGTWVTFQGVFFQRRGKEIIFHNVKAEVLMQSLFCSYGEFRQSVDHA